MNCRFGDGCSGLVMLCTEMLVDHCSKQRRTLEDFWPGLDIRQPKAFTGRNSGVYSRHEAAEFSQAAAASLLSAALSVRRKPRCCWREAECSRLVPLLGEPGVDREWPVDVESCPALMLDVSARRESERLHGATSESRANLEG